MAPPFRKVAASAGGSLCLCAGLLLLGDYLHGNSNGQWLMRGLVHDDTLSTAPVPQQPSGDSAAPRRLPGDIDVRNNYKFTVTVNGTLKVNLVYTFPVGWYWFTISLHDPLMPIDESSFVVTDASGTPLAHSFSYQGDAVYPHMLFVTIHFPSTITAPNQFVVLIGFTVPNGICFDDEGFGAPGKNYIPARWASKWMLPNSRATYTLEFEQPPVFPPAVEVHFGASTTQGSTTTVNGNENFFGFSWPRSVEGPAQIYAVCAPQLKYQQQKLEDVPEEEGSFVWLALLISGLVVGPVCCCIAMKCNGGSGGSSGGPYGGDGAYGGGGGGGIGCGGGGCGGGIGGGGVCG